MFFMGSLSWRFLHRCFKITHLLCAPVWKTFVNTLNFPPSHFKFATLPFGSSWNLPPLSSSTFFKARHNKRCIRKIPPEMGLLKERKRKISYLNIHGLHSIHTCDQVQRSQDYRHLLRVQPFFWSHIFCSLYAWEFFWAIISWNSFVCLDFFGLWAHWLPLTVGLKLCFRYTVIKMPENLRLMSACGSFQHTICTVLNLAIQQSLWYITILFEVENSLQLETSQLVKPCGLDRKSLLDER